MKRNYTLIEMLTVMTIIAILAGLIIPAVNKSRQRAKETQCLNNLRQIGIALTSYKGQWDEYFPTWLSDLSLMKGKTKYLPQYNVYHCPMDSNIGEGRSDANWRLNKPGEGGKDEVETANNCTDIYDYPRKGTGRSDPPQKDGRSAIQASYLYEFNGAVKIPDSWASASGAPSWLKTGLTWQQYKMLVIRKGSGEDITDTRYTFTKGRFRDRLSFFPMVRCFWHMKGFNSSANFKDTQDKPVFNVSVAGNVFSSLSYWEREGGTWK